MKKMLILTCTILICALFTTITISKEAAITNKISKLQAEIDDAKENGFVFTHAKFSYEPMEDGPYIHGDEEKRYELCGIYYEKSQDTYHFFVESGAYITLSNKDNVADSANFYIEDNRLYFKTKDTVSYEYTLDGDCLRFNGLELTRIE